MFKPIKDYPSYEINDHGYIRRVGKPGLLSPYIDVSSGGYLKIKLYNKGKRKTWTISRLVARTFLGDPPNSKYDASHLDGNPTNNHISNIIWIIMKNNICRHIAEIQVPVFKF